MGVRGSRTEKWVFVRRNGKRLRQTERSPRDAPVPPAERCGAERSPGAERSVPVAVLPPLPPGSEGGARGFGWKNDEGGAARRRNSLRICREPPVRPFSGAVFPLLLGSRGEGAGSGAVGLRVGGCGGLRGRGGRAAALPAGPGGRGCHHAGGGEAGLGRGRWYLPQKCSNPLPSLLSARWAHCDGDAVLSARGLHRPPADSRRLVTAAVW